MLGSADVSTRSNGPTSRAGTSTGRPESSIRAVAGLPPKKSAYEGISSAASRTIAGTDASRVANGVNEQAKTVEEFVSIHYRDRARLMPDSPLAKFTDINAPGYGAWRYAEPSGEDVLVFVRQSSAMTMQVMTLKIIGNFDEIYPPLRGKIGQMLANSTVTLH